MDEALLDAFRATHFLVCIDEVEWADIRVDQVLPASLQLLVGKRAWGFITAWNPQAEFRPEAENLVAQRQLHEALTQFPGVTIHAGIGVGNEWREPSLFVVGPDADALDALAVRHRQIAYVHGQSDQPALLRVLG